jgi:hypothetical protein
MINYLQLQKRDLYFLKIHNEIDELLHFTANNY